MLGSPIPKFTIGSIIGFRFHGLDFSTNIYAALGQKSSEISKAATLCQSNELCIRQVDNRQY